MSALFGTRVTDTNIRLRLLLIFLGGTIALASILFWKEKENASAEYVYFPAAKHLAPNINLED